MIRRDCDITGSLVGLRVESSVNVSNSSMNVFQVSVLPAGEEGRLERTSTLYRRAGHPTGRSRRTGCV